MAKTAAELMAEMQNDPQGRAVRASQDQRMAEKRRLYAHAAEGLFADLRAAGVDADSLADVRAAHDKRAVPALIDWLTRTDHLGLIEDIAKTLGSRWTGRAAVEALFNCYERSDAETEAGGRIRWACAAALQQVVTEADFDRVLKLATEPSSHVDNALLIAALGKMRSHRDEVVPVLQRLIVDPATTGPAIQAFAKLGDQRQLALIEPYTRDSDDWVREEAKKAVRSLSK